MPTSNTSDQKLIPFRANEWWLSKAMLMMGLVYFFTILFELDFSSFIKVVLPSLATIVGFAAFGYLVNDLFDRKADALANKKNSLQDKSALYISLLFGTALSFIFAPWLYLPSNELVFILIGLELLLFLAYSIPPLRLKDRGFWGVGIDALYAHALPAIIAGYTYALIAKAEIVIEVFLLLFLWQFLVGIRNILMHQHDDKEADLLSNAKTYIVSSNKELKQLIKPILILECLTAVLFFTYLTKLNLIFGLVLLCFFSATAFIAVIYAKRGFYQFLDSTCRHYPNIFYEKWMPLLLLIILSFSDTYFLTILLIHTLLFTLDYWKFIYQKIVGLYLSIPFSGIFFNFYITIRSILSWIINQIIFIFFLLFRVNLKNENCSALEYLKRKKKKEHN